MPEGPLFGLDGVFPRVAADAFIAPTAAVIGDVEIGAEASVWFHCVLRGDMNLIRVGARSNIQDGTIIHVNGGNAATIIGCDVTVGHMAIVHACTLHDGAFVAMGATVLDGAVIEPGGMLAAGSLLPPGKVIAAGELWMGTPAKRVRAMDAQERAIHAMTAPHYVAVGARFRAGLRART